MIVLPRNACCCAAFLLLLLACSCGQVGEPVYPSAQIPGTVGDLVGVERGDVILVSFTIPPRTTDGLLLRRIRGIELHLDPVDKTIDVPPPEEPGRVDAKIPIAGLVGQTITITERTRGGKGHYSEWSNTVTLDVEAPLPPPTEVVAKAVSAGVEVNWRANGATSFHIFRSDENTKIPQQAGTSDSTTYTDKTTEYDKHYQYFVQALRGKTESEVSAPVDITPVDVFPPAVPAGITATTGIAAIELAWERNTEPDFAKYIIWRAAGDGPFQKLAETDSPVYSDKAVKSGTRYRYSISAVDQKGNESQRSAPVEATSP